MSLQYAILGLLNYSEMTGYDLKKTIDSSVNLFWSAQTSQIYRDLGNLEQKGYVSHTVVNQEDRPDKKVFKITDEGKKAFIEWLADYPKDVITRERLLIHLFFSASLDLDIVKREIEIYKKNQEEALEKIVNNKKLNFEVEKELENEKMFWKLCALKGKYGCEANIKWAEHVLEILNESKKN